ncbi:MAG: DNA alkylation repair protein [Planctomycetota bacterium]|jgi:3-methyladenine DNA glycosylase AlkD
MSSGSFKELMAALRAAGSPAVAEQYAAGGVSGPCFGVPAAEVETLAEATAPAQAMALQLYETGVFEARLLATRLAEPDKITAANCDRWIKACQEPQLSGAVAALIAATIHAEKKSDVWRGSKGEWKRVCGWNIVQLLAEPDVALHTWLKRAVGEVHRGYRSAPASVQCAMRAALAAIGGHRPEFRERVLGLAKKLKLPDVTAGVEALQAQWEAGA